MELANYSNLSNLDKAAYRFNGFMKARAKYLLASESGVKGTEMQEIYDHMRQHEGTYEFYLKIALRD